MLLDFVSIPSRASYRNTLNTGERVSGLAGRPIMMRRHILGDIRIKMEQNGGGGSVGGGLRRFVRT